MNVLGGLAWTVPARASSERVCAGQSRMDAELGFIFVLILVTDCIASIYLDDLSDK